jgi:hypothetical protein
MEVRMQMIGKAAVFGLGVLASGTALADDSFAGSPVYVAQYAYNTSPFYYGTYPTSYPNYPGYPYYYGYNYPGYAWYPGSTYAWDPTAPWHPYSHSNPNWVPYAGWR